MISDKTAYRRYLDGEEKAADLLVERYGDALTLYINGYIKDIHEAEDLMIEAFAQPMLATSTVSSQRSGRLRVRAVLRHISTKSLVTLPFGISRNTVLCFCAWMSWTLSRGATPLQRRLCSAANETASFMTLSKN